MSRMLRTFPALVSFSVSVAGASGQVLFADNFDDGNANGWEEYDATFRVVNGEYEIDSITNGYVDGRSVAGNAGWTDIVFEADFRNLSSRPGRTAFLFRVVDIGSGIDVGHYYQFQVDTVGDGVGFCRISNSGGNCDILATAPFASSPDVTYRIRVEIVGATATAYVDGVPVLSYAGFTHYPAGRVGLKTIFAVSRFDNVQVRRVTGCPTGNVALNKPASASTSYLPWNQTPDKGVDGVYGDWMNPTFREHGWGSTGHDPAWFQVDLRSPVDLTSYRAYNYSTWEPESYFLIDVKVSLDGQAWTVVDRQRYFNHRDEWLEVPMPGGTRARYVQVDFTYTSFHWMGLMELEVYGSTAGDFDGDGDVDLSDFAFFQLCYSGSNNPPPAFPPECSLADLDCDGDVDLADFTIFQQNFTGSR